MSCRHGKASDRQSLGYFSLTYALQDGGSSICLFGLADGMTSFCRLGYCIADRVVVTCSRVSALKFVAGELQAVCRVAGWDKCGCSAAVEVCAWEHERRAVAFVGIWAAFREC